jgi:hypothetical protein
VTAGYYWLSEARPIRIGVARIHGRKSRWGVSGEDGTFFKPRQAASGSSLKLRKDHGTSAKYFVPETRNSPFTGWNNTGSFNRYDWWDTFGVKSDESASGSLSPFQLSANMLVNSSHLTVSPFNTFAYPDLGRAVTGRFHLTHLDGLGGGGGDFSDGSRSEDDAVERCKRMACVEAGGICCAECFKDIMACNDYRRWNCVEGWIGPFIGGPWGPGCRGGRWRFGGP